MKSTYTNPNKNSHNWLWLLLSLFFLTADIASSFSTNHYHPLTHRRQSFTTTSLFDILDDEINKSNLDDGVDIDNFNPLSYNNAGKSSSSSSMSFNDSLTSGNPISLRRTQMQDLNFLLLDAVRNEAETQRLLTEYKDFLLEPLEDMDAVLDPDSVYAPNMNREERYKAFRKSMDERLATVKNPQVEWVVQSLRDFILSFE